MEENNISLAVGRSAIMAGVGQKDTKPELAVRRTLHALGFRFRLQRKDLPGTPDIVLPKFKTAILVHGCFWHRHANCRLTTTPKTRAEFWAQKFDANVKRDTRNESALSAMGWRVVVIWECESRSSEALERILLDNLTRRPSSAP